MEKRVRSPNYPAISLPDALEKVSALYKSLHTHPGPREVIAKGMGYASLNGASMSVISALNKYGLLEGRGDEIKISDRAMRILHPESPEERAVAIREAAESPQLFAELNERFQGAAPNEELLRNYLVRRNFAPRALSHIILSYRETKELVEAESGGYDSSALDAEGSTAMQPQTSAALAKPAGQAGHIIPPKQGDERTIGRYDFEGGGYIHILKGGDIDTEEALDMAETIIQLKRREIERRRKVIQVPDASPGEDSEDDIENEFNA